MPAKKSTTPSAATTNQTKDIAEKVAVSLLDKNKDGDYKDDLFRMFLDFVKSKFAKK